MKKNDFRELLSSRTKRYFCVAARALSFVALNSIALPVAAADFSVSGFGTLGYARSDKPYTYQRFIDQRGTFRRDSVAGLQVDAKFAGEFGATVQIKAAPDVANDRQYEGTVSWAFLSYRPTNDWLLRLGKQRIPLYLYSQNYDVGATYPFARLPTEMYSIVPSNDFIGFSATRSWTAMDGEFSLEWYLADSKTKFRTWLRDGIPSVQESGAVFTDLSVKASGLVLTHKAEHHTLRVTLGKAIVKLGQGQPFGTGFPFVSLAPGIGYYQVDPSLPGPGVQTAQSLTNTTVAVGGEVDLPAGFRIVSEFAHSVVPESDLAPQGTRGYGALLKHAGKWTPYVTYAFMRSAARSRNFYAKVNDNMLPAFIPGAAQINASQRVGADNIIAFDQSSWAVGTSYSFSATSRVKAEYMQTRVGDVSVLVDAPSGSNIRNQSINVFSLSYSFVF